MLLDSFCEHFQELDYNILWIGFLDPRQTDMFHLSADKKIKARNYFVQQVIGLIEQIAALNASCGSEQSEYESDEDLGYGAVYRKLKRQKKQKLPTK